MISSRTIVGTKELDLPGRSQRPDANVLATIDLSGAEWDRVITEFADPYYEQTHAYRGAVWGEHRVRRLAILRGGKVAAMALVLLFKVPLINRGLAHAKFAPLWRRKNEPDDQENLRLAVKALIDEFVVRQKLSLTVMPPADPRFTECYRDVLSGCGFSHKDVEDPDRYLVNIQLVEKEQLASLDQKWRYNLKAALKNEFSISAETSLQSLAIFDAMFSEMEKRKNYSNASWPPFRDAMKASFEGPVTPSIILVRSQGVPVAGAVIGHIGETAYYLYGATSDRAIELRAGYAMHWWIVGWLRSKQSHWYDLGGGAGEPGLQQFKKGLAGKQGAIASLPGDFTLSRDFLSGAIAQTVLGLRALRTWIKLRRIAVRRRLRNRGSSTQR